MHFLCDLFSPKQEDAWLPAGTNYNRIEMGCADASKGYRGSPSSQLLCHSYITYLDLLSTEDLFAFTKKKEIIKELKAKKTESVKESSWQNSKAKKKRKL